MKEKLKIHNITPGEILLEEFLKPVGITMYRLSKEIGVPQIRISNIINNKTKITPDTAIRFSMFFGNSAEFWLGIQNSYDLEELQVNKSKFEHINKYVAA